MSAAQSSPTNQTTSDDSVVRSTGSMAIATLISRLTGFLRNLLIGAALGPAISSAFNSANTLPNLITEIVLGAVLTSLVVPVLVRAEKEDPDKGARFFRQLFTISLTVLVVIATLAVLAAPILTRMSLADGGEVNVFLATNFAILLLPQILFYGLFALFMAVLNTKGVFKPGAWAPVAHNVIAIAVLLLYWVVPGANLDAYANPMDPPTLTHPGILLLGIGTTLGVVAQFAIMIPPMRRAGIDMRPLWGIDDRLKEFAGMGVAIVVYVAISQAGYMITNRWASIADAAAPNIYQQSWLLLQVPYGIVGVTLLTAMMPQLSRNAADNNTKAVVNDLTTSTKLTFIALLPVIVFMTAFGRQIANALFAYGKFPPETADILGRTLSYSAFTLVPYALVMLHLRVFYAREQAWTPTAIILAITSVKVGFSWLALQNAPSKETVVQLLGAANGLGFVAGAIIGAMLLKRSLGSLQAGAVLHSAAWIVGAAMVGVAVAMPVDWLLSVTGVLDPVGSFGYLLRTGIAGVLFLIVTGLVLSRSGLAEVMSIGRLLAKLPVLGKLIKVPEAPPQTSDSIAAQVDATMLGDGMASPLMPPLPAGQARGKRQLPGSYVANGRFRLLVDHGGAPGLGFWRARDVERNVDVALTIYDAEQLASGTPMSPEHTAQQVAERTQALAQLRQPGMARILAVVPDTTGGVVVSEWVAGSSLATVADAAPDPWAAAHAVTKLTEAVVAAHAQGTALGIDHRARLRVAVDGNVVLAFPALTPAASYRSDIRGLGTVLALLVNRTSDLDTRLRVLIADTRNLRVGGAGEVLQRLRNLP